MATISVIEPATPREVPSGARMVPFGFARALSPDPDQVLRDAAVELGDDTWSDYARAVVGVS